MAAIYVPVLKSKMGELTALKELDPAIRLQLFPVFDVAPIGWDYDNDEPDKTVDAHLAKLPDNLQKSIGLLPCAVDLTWVGPGARMVSGAHPLGWLFGEFRSRGVVAVPVVGPGYDPAYVSAAASVVSTDRRGAVVRVVGQSRLFAASLASDIAALLTNLAIAASDADLLIDLQAVPPGTEAAAAVATASILIALPNLGAWRTVAVAASSFPKDLSAFAHGLGVVDRACWGLWNRLRMQPGLSRLPTFGDYAVDHYDRSEPEVPPWMMKGSTNVRYTIAREWLVLKGPNWKDNSFAPMKGMCATLVADPRFSGATFSSGDGYIEACANGGPTGNAMTWRKVGTNHHLTFVARQVASLRAASVASGRSLLGPGAEPPP